MTSQILPPRTEGHEHEYKPGTQHIESATTDASNKNVYKNVKTQALVVNEPKADFKLETVYLDEVRGDELLIDMKFSGICHTVCTETIP